MILCPLCKGKGKLGMAKVSLTRNVIVYRNRSAKLSNREAEIASVILDKGRLIFSEIVRRVYGVTETEWSSISVHVTMVRLRAKLRQIGLVLINTSKVGWGLPGEYMIVPKNKAKVKRK